MTFGMIVEDPFYDEDGVLIDEDADLEKITETSDDEHEPPEACYIMDYDPYATVNS